MISILSTGATTWRGTQTVSCKLPTYLGGDPGDCDSANAPEDYAVNERGYSCPKDTACAVRCAKYWDKDKTTDEYGPYSSKRTSTGGW